MLLTAATRKANPHRTNLVITTDAQRYDYRYLDMGFVWHYSHEANNQGTEFYDTCYYEMPQLLIPRIHNGYMRDGVDYSKVVDAVRQANWISKALDLYNQSCDLVDRIRRIKKMDMSLILHEINWWGLSLSEDESIKGAMYVAGSPLSLRPHQLQSLALYLTLGYTNNWGQMRTGKTPPTIIYCYFLFLTEKVDSVLIICPNSIKHIWLSELGRFTNTIVPTISHVIEGTKAQKTKLWEAHSLFKIVNYESLRSDIQTVHQVYDGKRIALVLDESHNVKNASLQTKAVQSLCSSGYPPSYFVALSGTPVANKPQDVARVVQMTAPGMLGKSYDDFVRRFCYTGGYSGGEVTGYKPNALDNIHSQMARISVRALRADVDMELGKIIQPQELKMSGEQKKVHDDLRDTLRAELYGWGNEWTAVRINSFLAQVMKLQQVTAGFLYDNNKMTHWIDDKKNPKFKWLDAFIDEYLYDIKKLVIACRFVPVIKRLVSRYQHHGCVSIYGAVKGIDRVRAMQEFTTNDDCRVMVLNSATSEGLDLNPCQFMTFITKSFQPKINWQTEDRITGYNQIGEASIIPLLMEDSIDVSLEAILAKKQEWFDAVMGDKGKTTPRVLEGGLSITRDDLFTLVG